MMVMKYFLSGLFVKLLAGFDDTMTRIPIMSNMTKTKKGRYAFAIGIFIAVSLAIFLAFSFALLIKSIPYVNFISAGLIFLLAMSIQFNLFTEKPKKEIRKKLSKIQRVSTKRFFKLILLGFITAFVTVIDDIIAYSGLFVSQASNTTPIILGFFAGTIIQLTAIIYFSQKFSKIKYKKEITVVGLVLLSLLIALKIL
jgi:hypothetical protein